MSVWSVTEVPVLTPLKSAGRTFALPPAESSDITRACRAGATMRAAIPKVRVKRVRRFIGAFLSSRPSHAVDYQHDGTAAARRFRPGCRMATPEFDRREASRSAVPDPG